MSFNPSPIDPRQFVAYLDLSGGRNTKKDPHALDRNQLAVSDNTWMAQGNTIAKRPGSISVPTISSGHFAGGAISAGGTGFGISLVGMVTGRFANTTCLIVQDAANQVAAAPITQLAISAGFVNSWVSIGGISGGTIAAAQLFDPDPANKNGPDGTVFIVTGKDVPQAWWGIGQPLRPLTYLEPNQIPQKADGSGKPITPAYVATLFSSLFYAGEPTDPSMVYISNPFLPEQFTENLIIPTNTITGASYIGLPVGRGDGIGGGSITGMATMGSAMLVYKQSAIYAVTMVGIVGDMVWGASVASSSVGMTSPRSLVAFDTFHVFLGIDGVYVFDGTTTTKISANNPDLFDGGFSPTPLIQNRSTAIAVRYGNRYIIFFDDGGGTGVALGYCNRGAWFDFDKLDADGLPSCGTMSGFNVGGVAPLRGPQDQGNFAWCDATHDRVALFNAAANGAPWYFDFANPITVSVTGKADFFADIWADSAPVCLKALDSVDLLMSFPIIQSGQEYVFNGTVAYDQLNAFGSVGIPTPFPLVGEAIVGQAIVGSAVIGILSGTPAYEYLPMYQPEPPHGYIVQYAFNETSGNPWTCLGYVLYINKQQKVGADTSG